MLDDLKEKQDLRKWILKEYPLTWQYVIQCNVGGMHIDYFFKNLVLPSFYKYFLFNDRVFIVLNDDFEETGYFEQDIK